MCAFCWDSAYLGELCFNTVECCKPSSLAQFSIPDQATVARVYSGE